MRTLLDRNFFSSSSNGQVAAHRVTVRGVSGCARGVGLCEGCRVVRGVWVVRGVSGCARGVGLCEMCRDVRGVSGCARGVGLCEGCRVVHGCRVVRGVSGCARDVGLCERCRAVQGVSGCARGVGMCEGCRFLCKGCRVVWEVEVSCCERRTMLISDPSDKPVVRQRHSVKLMECWVVVGRGVGWLGTGSGGWGGRAAAAVSRAIPLLPKISLCGKWPGRSQVV